VEAQELIKVELEDINQVHIKAAPINLINPTTPPIKAVLQRAELAISLALARLKEPQVIQDRQVNTAQVQLIAIKRNERK
jgi:hypothetical protein